MLTGVAILSSLVTVTPSQVSSSKTKGVDPVALKQVRNHSSFAILVNINNIIDAVLPKV